MRLVKVQQAVVLLCQSVEAKNIDDVSAGRKERVRHNDPEVVGKHVLIALKFLFEQLHMIAVEVELCAKFGIHRLNDSDAVL